MSPPVPPPPESPKKATRFQRALAWSAHAYTAVGLLMAAGIAVMIVRGGDDSFRWAFGLMVAATVVDATDGWWARRVRVHDVTPDFDGRRLDDLIDFHTYTSLPLLLLWRAGIPAPGWEWVLLFPLVASAYGFCQVSAKTDDGYFLGFPSYWNILALYLYVLEPPAAVSAVVLVGFALLTFLPTRYLYPSQPGRLNRVTTILGAFWGAMLAAILWTSAEAGLRAERPVAIAWASLFFPAYYLLVSWGIEMRIWLLSARGERPA